MGKESKSRIEGERKKLIWEEEKVLKKVLSDFKVILFVYVIPHFAFCRMSKLCDDFISASHLPLPSRATFC